MVSARRLLHTSGAFKMMRGQLIDPVIAYETWGHQSRDRDNTVLIFTGLSPSAHVASSPEDTSAGWWEDMVGPDKPIDTNRYFVVCINSIGSCFGSTGPASVDAQTGEPYRLTFPVLCVEDIAKAGAEVIRSLGIESVFATVGASMGGMTALAFCMLFPDMSRALVSISSASRALPFSIALRSLQREMIHKDPAWNQGNYAAERSPVVGMRLARKLGMITYRSSQEWEQRFGRERATDETLKAGPFGIDFEVESYLEAHANKFIGAFDANCYLYLSRAMDLFDAADHGGQVADGLARVSVDRALVIGVETDFLFPLHQQRELADGLGNTVAEVDFRPLASIQGHDSFLVDMDRFRPAIASFF
ncbi:MAG: homoserine O-acetyltransferase [Gammaproteobacteria bacterium]|nr:MAG: homoserine O-acetyltransferase [Gammaproteobacteria bacterium]